MNLFKDNIRYLRRRLNMSQATFGISLGYDRGRISSWEGGQGKPNAEALIEVSKKLGYSAEELMNINLQLREQAPVFKERYGIPEIPEPKSTDLVSLLNRPDKAIESPEIDHKSTPIETKQEVMSGDSKTRMITLTFPADLIDDGLLLLIANYIKKNSTSDSKG